MDGMKPASVCERRMTQRSHSWLVAAPANREQISVVVSSNQCASSATMKKRPRACRLEHPDHHVGDALADELGGDGLSLRGGRQVSINDRGEQGCEWQKLVVELCDRCQQLATGLTTVPGVDAQERPHCVTQRLVGDARPV